MRASYLTDKNRIGASHRQATLPQIEIRYGLHFPILAVAALVFWFWLTKRRYHPYWFGFDAVDFHFGLMGALHATCVVVSLRVRKAAHLLIALWFVPLAAVLSAWTPTLGSLASVVWLPILELIRMLKTSPHSGLGGTLLLVTGSAVGASGYWLLVRLFWLKSLRRTDLLRTVALCVAATLLAWVFAEALDAKKARIYGLHEGEVFDLLLTVAWWFAFSISLYLSETRGCAKQSIGALACSP